MSSSKPIKLYSHARGPNPWKVVIILNELGLAHESEFMDFPDMKKEPFTEINPNGRVPAIEDPNTGVKMWESGAIIRYLLEVYDKDNKLSYTSSPEKYLQYSWADFQMSGQGPYFGQKAWFAFYHSEKLPSAVERYTNEMHRVLGVIDAHLSRTGKPFLVGDKVCYADLMFVPWNNGLLIGLLTGENSKKDWQEKYPKAWEWHQKLIAMPSVRKMEEAKAKASESGH